MKLPSVDKFVNRLATAERSNQKDIRLTIQEARELSLELTLLTSELAGIVVDINGKLDKIAREPIEVVIGGGKLG